MLLTLDNIITNILSLIDQCLKSGTIKLKQSSLKVLSQAIAGLGHQNPLFDKLLLDTYLPIFIMLPLSDGFNMSDGESYAFVGILCKLYVKMAAKYTNAFYERFFTHLKPLSMWYCVC